MTTKQIILNKLIKENPDNAGLSQLNIKQFNLSPIKKIPEITINNKPYNALLRFSCNGIKGNKWVGSRKLYLNRKEVNQVITGDISYFPYEKLPATYKDIVDFIFTNANLEFDPEWLLTPNKLVNKLPEFQPLIENIELDESKSIYFTGKLKFEVRYTKEPIDYIKRNELDLYKILLRDLDTRTHLIPYSFNFINTRSILADRDFIKTIDNQTKVKNNLRQIINLINDLSGETWSVDASITENRPGGYFEFAYNGELTKEKMDILFGKDTFLPINRRYNKALILKLNIPEGSQSIYAGHLFLYYTE